jgi:hypothetical protein
MNYNWHNIINDTHTNFSPKIVEIVNISQCRGTITEKGKVVPVFN